MLVDSANGLRCSTRQAQVVSAMLLLLLALSVPVLCHCSTDIGSRAHHLSRQIGHDLVFEAPQTERPQDLVEAAAHTVQSELRCYHTDTCHVRRPCLASCKLFSMQRALLVSLAYVHTCAIHVAQLRG